MLFSFKETLCNFVHFGQQTNIKYYSPQSESDCGELLLNVCWRPEMTIDQHLGTIMNTKIAPLRPKVCSSDHDVHFVFRRHGCCNCFDTPELQNQAFLVTTCRIKNLGSSLKCRLVQKARQNTTAPFLLQSSSQLVK